MISKSVLTIRFGLAKNKKRQAEANMFYPVCMIIEKNKKEHQTFKCDVFR